MLRHAHVSRTARGSRDSLRKRFRRSAQILKFSGQIGTAVISLASGLEAEVPLRGRLTTSRRPGADTIAGILKTSTRVSFGVILDPCSQFHQPNYKLKVSI